MSPRWLLRPRTLDHHGEQKVAAKLDEISAFGVSETTKVFCPIASKRGVAAAIASADPAKSPSHEKRASGVHPGAASENSGARVSTDRRKAYAKRESVLVITVGILDATAR